MYQEGRWSTGEVGSGEIKGKNGGKCLIEPVQTTNLKNLAFNENKIFPNKTKICNNPVIQMDPKVNICLWIKLTVFLCLDPSCIHVRFMIVVILQLYIN